MAWSRPDVIVAGAPGFGRGCLFPGVGRHADEQVRGKLAHRRGGKVAVAEMDAVGPCQQGDVQPVVDDEKGSCRRGFSPEKLGLGKKGAVVRYLVPQLDDARSAGQNGLQPLFIRPAAGQLFTGNRVEGNLLDELGQSLLIETAGRNHFCLPMLFFVRNMNCCQQRDKNVTY